VTQKLFSSFLILCIAVIGLAAPASAQNQTTPTLLSKEKVDWIAGTSEWINLSWTTEDELENVELRVVRQSSGLTFEYPNGADHSSLMTDSTLSANEIDFTALKITTDASVNGDQRATLEITWDNNGQPQSASGLLHFSNKKYNGDDFAILTEDASVSLAPLAPEANWVELAYKGLAPTTTDMQITASGPLPVYHPQETFTSLHHDQTLHAGESDVARIWFDPDLLQAGTHALTVTITYTDSKGTAKQISHEVKLLVSP
jgi:hypothetical protein